jgi:hypothetical protein
MSTNEKITAEELEQAEGEQLPDREEMAAMPLPDPFGGGLGTMNILPVEPDPPE